MPIITISRQMYSFGDEIAQVLAQKIGCELIDREKLLTKFLKDIATPHEIKMLHESAKFYLNKSSSGETFLEYLKRSLFDYAKNNSLVLSGFGAQMIFVNPDKNVMRVRVIASQEARIARVKKQYHVSEKDADQIIYQGDRKYKKFIYTLYESDWTDLNYYDMIINTNNVSVDEGVASIIAFLKEREIYLQIEKEAEEGNGKINISERPVFKNIAEEEFAKILDMYHIEWKYEPKTFPVEWDAEGKVTSAFSPDFYLTNFDTYIELTTMSQKYVTQKNKKLKMLNKLYPGVNVKIVYKKDFYSLLDRFKVSKGE